VKLGTIYPKFGNAEFWVVFAPGPKVEQVKFISGDGNIRALGDTLRSVKFNVLFPEEHPARIVRRGVLVCETGNLGCDFTLDTPDVVASTQ